MTVEGAVDTSVFRSYGEQVLGPTLRRGDGVVMKNLTVHKVAGIAEAIRARGAHVEYLPPSSPDFTPVEQGGANSKRPCANARLGFGAP